MLNVKQGSRDYQSSFEVWLGQDIEPRSDYEANA